jgi:hypothetical protein
MALHGSFTFFFSFSMGYRADCGQIMHLLFNEGSNFCFSIASMALLHIPMDGVFWD